MLLSKVVILTWVGSKSEYYLTIALPQLPFPETWPRFPVRASRWPFSRMLELTTTLHQVKTNCNTNINILSIELFLFAMKIIYHSHHSSKAKKQFHKQINMPKRKLKPKASRQWKLYQSTNRRSELTKDRNIEGGTMSIIQKKPHKRPN